MSGKPWPSVDIEELFDVVLAQSQWDPEFYAVVIDESFLLVCQTALAWFSNDRYMQELLLLRFSDGGDVNAPLMYLESLARATDSRWIEFGTELSANDEAVASLLTRNGYSRFGINLIKEV